jgi:hypothetical protein
MRHSIILLALASIAGCAADAGEPESAVGALVIDAEDVASSVASGEKLVVDLRVTGQVTAFDPTAGSIDYEQIGLVCPNGTPMSMARWISAREDERGIDYSAMFFYLAPDAAAAEAARGDCGPGSCACTCLQCGDGAWVCSRACGYDTSGAEGDARDDSDRASSGPAPGSPGSMDRGGVPSSDGSYGGAPPPPGGV